MSSVILDSPPGPINPHFVGELNEELLAVLLEAIRVKDADWAAEGFFDSAGGQACFLKRPEDSVISVPDIALGLSRVKRWGGRTRADRLSLSVAQHSVMVSQLCKPEHAMVGLMHDASEAYLGDIISPLKRLLKPLYRPLEEKWCLEIGRRLGLGRLLAELPVDVVCADRIALEVERHDLMCCPKDGVWGLAERPTTFPPLKPVDENRAYQMFLERFVELGGRL